MVDRVECSREIQKDQCCKISTIDGQENVRKYRKKQQFQWSSTDGNQTTVGSRLAVAK